MYVLCEDEVELTNGGFVQFVAGAAAGAIIGEFVLGFIEGWNS